MVMTTNLREFNAGLDDFYKVNVVGETSQMVRRVAFAIDRELVMGTPVGNPDLWKRKPPKGYVGGRARANWIPTLGTPASEPVDRIDKQGSATIALLAGVTANYEIGDGIIWLTNVLPYMTALNDGHSTQAPKGYIEIAIEAGLREAMR